MSQISEFGERTQASFAEIGANVDDTKTKVDALVALVATLQNSPGAITPADQATLDQIEEKAKEISVRVKALDDATAPLPPALVPPKPVVPGPVTAENQPVPSADHPATMSDPVSNAMKGNAELAARNKTNSPVKSSNPK